MADKQEIEEFLLKVRWRIKNKKYDFINRDKYHLTKLGISIKEAVYLVNQLQIENYYRGPSKDHNGKGNLIYEFGYDLDDYQLYIKLTIREKDELFIMSFHKATRKISYPYKGEKIIA